METINQGNGSRRNFIRNAAIAALSVNAIPLLSEASGKQSLMDMDTNGLTVLFQGDSITDGNRGRNADPNHIMGHGYAFSIASRIGADFPEKKIKFINRGISGNKVTDLAKRWQQDTIDLAPGVLSILVGINDAASVIENGENQVSFSLYEETYDTILKQALDKFPNILFVLGQPFILPVGKVKDNREVWQSDVEKRGEIVQRLAEKYNAVFVPYQDVFNDAAKKAVPDYWIWDGIHPTVPGHELMTREWIKQVSKRLKFLKHYHY